jgi:hypothetical protein
MSEVRLADDAMNAWYASNEAQRIVRGDLTITANLCSVTFRFRHGIMEYRARRSDAWALILVVLASRRQARATGYRTSPK